MFRTLLLAASLLPFHSHAPLTDADEPKDPPYEAPSETKEPEPCEQWIQSDGGYVCAKPRKAPAPKAPRTKRRSTK